MSLKRLSSLLQYFFFFGAARGGLFLAPIVLANLLSPHDYGTLELAQAIASVAATIASLGTAAAVPLVIVRRSGSVSWGSVLAHQMLMVLLLLTSGALLAVFGLPSLFWLVCVCTCAFMLQALWSVVLRSHGRGEASLLVDAMFWGVLALAVSVATGAGVETETRGGWLFGSLFIYLMALVGWTISRFFYTRPLISIEMYVRTIKTSLPFMSTALLALLATTSGRIGVGLLSTPELMSDYAVLFRVTALPIVAHQLIIVARFRQIFELPVRDLELRLPIVVGLVTVCVVAFWLLSDIATWLLGAAFESAFGKNHSVGLLILTQCILWSAIALNDLVNTRAQTAGIVARASGVYFLVALPLAWWLLSSQRVTLSLFVPVHSAVMAGYFLTQTIVMWRCGVRLVRTWSLTLGCFVSLSVLTQLV